MSPPLTLSRHFWCQWSNLALIYGPCPAYFLDSRLIALRWIMTYTALEKVGKQYHALPFTVALPGSAGRLFIARDLCPQCKVLLNRSQRWGTSVSPRQSAGIPADYELNPDPFRGDIVGLFSDS